MADAQVQYNPLEGPTIRAWLKIQQYSQVDASWNIVDVWSHLKIASAVAMNDDIVRTEMMSRTLQSPINTGLLSGVMA